MDVLKELLPLSLMNNSNKTVDYTQAELSLDFESLILIIYFKPSFLVIYAAVHPQTFVCVHIRLSCELLALNVHIHCEI